MRAVRAVRAVRTVRTVRAVRAVRAVLTAALGVAGITLRTLVGRRERTGGDVVLGVRQRSADVGAKTREVLGVVRRAAANARNSQGAAGSPWRKWSRLRTVVQRWNTAIVPASPSASLPNR